MVKAMAKKIMAIMSVALPKLGCGYCSTFGLFKIVTGKLTIQTHSICATQNPRNGKNLSRLSSKRSSLPVFKMRKSKKPDKRAPHSIMKMDVTIWRASVVPDKARVRIASHTKFVPPMKSVSLSNLKVKAIEKPMSW